MFISSQALHSQYSEDKKQREYELVEQFLHVCSDFTGYTFMQFSENPDMIYEKGEQQIGFDSVIISEDQATVDCYFDEGMCAISLPTKLTPSEKSDKIAVFFENKLFKHWRRYALPTVLVFSLVDTELTTFDQLLNVAQRFELPEFSLFNISDYYLCDGKRFIKISETPKSKL
ncbi:hypothetical protein H0W80_05065 [Candidatus Saccharibacteria bacterium]|nr:hypothetical protein [Candidatus Saccharibacteria bacterium]